MTWGSFGIVHIVSLLIAVSIVIGLYFILKRCSKIVQTIVLGVLSFAGIAAIIFNLLMWDSPLEYLPLHLCSLNALILPIAVFTKSKVLNNLLLLWALGALCALVINTAQANYEIASWTFVFYFFPHTLEVGIPVLMFLLNHTQKDIRCMLSTFAITFIAFTIVHCINVELNEYCLENSILDASGNVIHVNYMYSLVPENPVLQWFYNIVPHPFWYMFLMIPVIFIYLCIIYCTEIVDIIRHKKRIKIKG